MELTWLGAKGATDERLDKAEAQYGIRFPADYRTGIKEFAGGSPNLECFDFSGRDEAVLDTLFSFDGDKYSGFAENNDDLGDSLPQGVYAIASDPFGNFICYDYRDDPENPPLVFYDHELEADDEMNLLKMCDTFSRFLAMLYDPDAPDTEGTDGNEETDSEEVHTLTPDDVEFVGGKIVKYLGASQAIQIPPELAGTAVTAIGKRAFEGKNLTAVQIPASVIFIDMLAFSHNQLTSVTIPDSMTTIKNSSFSHNQLASVTIPSSITLIDCHAFSGNQLTSVEIPDSITNIKGNAFTGNKLISVTLAANTKCTSYSFDQGVEILWRE